MNEIEQDYIRADYVKPDFAIVKTMWSNLLEKYFDNNGNIIKEFSLETDCPHCNNNGKKSVFNLNNFIHQTCINCNCIYVSPRLNDKALEEIYSNEYYSTMFTLSMIPYFDRRKLMIGKRKYEQIMSYFSLKKENNSNINILDIGAGIGEVISCFNDNGFNCEAIEMNKEAILFLKSNNIMVYDGLFDDFNTSKKFDIIMAWGVIEHVVNPRLFLNKVNKILNNGGIFISEVPNGQSLLVDYCRKNMKDPKRILMGEQHIVLYSPEAYEELHTSCGLEKIKVQTNGLDIETIISLEDKETIKLNDQVILKLQEQIDMYLKGDLIRGFWRKSRELN